MDMGCTSHFLATTAPHKNKQSTNNGISVRLPNQETMITSHMAELDLPDLPQAAQTAHIFPDLGATLLILVGQLCDADCTATFTNNLVTITHNDTTILSGNRNKHTKLWNITIPTAKQNKTDNQTDSETEAEQSAYNVNQTQKAAKLVAFAHESFFSPAITTLQQALNKNYINHFPGLTPKTLT